MFHGSFYVIYYADHSKMLHLGTTLLAYASMLAFLGGGGGGGGRKRVIKFQSHKFKQ